MGAATAGRGGGDLTAGGGGRGGGDVFITCGGGVRTLDGGAVRSFGAPFDGETLVTLAPVGVRTFVTVPLLAGGPFALCSLMADGEVCLERPVAGAVTSGCAP